MEIASKRWLLSVVLTILLCSCGSEERDASIVEEADVDALRSLPYLDFSPEKASAEHGVVVLDRERSYPGFNLVSYRRLCRAELIDAQGQVIRFWEQSECRNWSNVELLPMGDIVVPGMDPIETGSSDNAGGARESMKARFLVRLDSEGNVVWKARLPAHHDVGLTPRNQLVTLTTGYRKAPELDDEAVLHDASIALLTLDGGLIEELSLYDLFAANPEQFPLKNVRVQMKQGLKEIPLFHANSVHWVNQKHLEGRHPIYDSGTVLVTIRHQDVVVAVNWDEKKIVWMWGRDELMGPHDGSVLDNGHVLIFDNGLGRGWSRIVEIDPVSEKIVWEYKAPDPNDFYTASRGSNQRLPNGNTLIAMSDRGELFEVTPEGDIVWRYLSPHLNEGGHRATIVRADRYERDFIEGLLSEKSANQ